VDPVSCPFGSSCSRSLESLSGRLHAFSLVKLMPVDGTPPRGSSASSRPVSVPNWDLLIVLEGLLVPYFKPLESAPDRILTLKVVLLLASASKKGGSSGSFYEWALRGVFPWSWEDVSVTQAWLCPQSFVHILSLSSGQASFFLSSSFFLSEGGHLLCPVQMFGVCGPHWPVTQFLWVVCMLWG